jgi:hypothetical protein
VPGSVSVTDITETTAEITWTTNTSSDSRVNYGTTTGLGQTKYDATEGTVHNIILTGLTQGTKYYFEVESTDISETSTDDNGGAYYSFTTLAPATYAISLEPACGVCGDLVDVGVCGEIIEVTAVVAAADTYYVCWDSKAAWNSDQATGKVGEFTASGAGIYTITFFMPEADMDEHSVYLTDDAYNQKGDPATFEVSPSVKIDLEEGPVGTEVTLNGYGFPGSKQIRVILYQGEIEKGGAESDTADAKGTWGPISYTIPDTPAGRYTLNIEANEGSPVGWVTRVRKDFEVTPQITTNTGAGTVGQTIDVSGTGFASEEEDIEITFDGEVVQTNDPIVADEDGSWEAMLRIPPLQRGTYRVDASGESTRARDVPDIEFIVGAGVWVEPGMAYVGDTITVTGGGFAPEETGVRVTFDGTVVATSISVDTNGSWESSFDLQASTYCISFW